jgi:hypothetical protein
MEEEEGLNVRPRRTNSYDSNVGGKFQWSSGSCLEQGKYKYMEDRCVNFNDVMMELCRADLSKLSIAGDIHPSQPPAASLTGYFGVFDGHAGHEAAVFVSESLHLHILK